MKIKAVRLHGVNDLRLDEFELPEIRDDEILAKAASDSICMSGHKLALQGAKRKRARHDLACRQPVAGHEFCGTIEKGKSDPFFAKLAGICGRHNGLWNTEAEKYFLENAAGI